MKIEKCPKCGRVGSLHYKPRRKGSMRYPSIKHYDSSKKSLISWCNIPISKLSKIQFSDSGHHLWSSVVEPRLWYIIPGLISSNTKISQYEAMQEKIRSIIHSVEHSPDITPTTQAYVSLPFFHLGRKRTIQILRGHVKKVPLMFDPKSRDDAILDNFRGVQCPNCRSWRTDLATDSIQQCVCFACDARFDAGIKPRCDQCHYPFYDDVIKEMITKNTNVADDEILTRCLRCKKEVHFPKEELVKFLITLSI